MLSRRVCALVVAEVAVVAALVAVAERQAAAVPFGPISLPHAEVPSAEPSLVAPSTHVATVAAPAAETPPGGTWLWQYLNGNVGSTAEGEQSLLHDLGAALRDQVLHVISTVEPGR